MGLQSEATGIFSLDYPGGMGSGMRRLFLSETVLGLVFRICACGDIGISNEIYSQ
jgi:hypothetical protein